MRTIPNGTKVAKDCPHCKRFGRGQVKLIVRTNRQNTSQFLGCPNWPMCEYTEAIPESMMMELLGQPKLF